MNTPNRWLLLFALGAAVASGCAKAEVGRPANTETEEEEDLPDAGAKVMGPQAATGAGGAPATGSGGKASTSMGAGGTPSEGSGGKSGGSGGASGSGGSPGGGGSPMAMGGGGMRTPDAGGASMMPPGEYNPTAVFSSMDDTGCKDPTVAEGKLADFEDNGIALAAVGMRMGKFYTFNDKSAGATQDPASGKIVSVKGGACGSQYAFWTKGSGFSKWGAGIGVAFNRGPDKKLPYSIKDHSGISFFIRGGLKHVVRFRVQDVANTPTSDDGTCAKDCSNYFGKDISVTTSWAKVDLKFADLMPEHAGAGAKLDLAQVLGIQFITNEKTTQFEYWIDNLSLTK